MEEFGGGWRVGVAALRDLEVAEAAKDEFARAGCGFVVCEGGDGGKVGGNVA
jgi:hypothetical protein